MADTTRPDIFDSQPESSGNSNDDFEKLDAPSSGFYDGTGGDVGLDAAAADAGAYDYDIDHQQETEISSTADIGGEEEAEEDRYNAGASEADYYTHSPEPLISLGNEDPFQVQGVQPSAPPVSEISQPEPLIDFDNSTGSENDILGSFASSTLPTSKIQESISPNIVESEKEKNKEVSEQIPEETSKGNEINFTKESQPTVPPSADTKNHSGGFTSRAIGDFGSTSPFEQTQVYKALVALGSWLKGVDPRVKDLIYWRDVRTTGVVFGSMLVVLISLAIFSLLSILAYLSLACLSVTFTFVVYKKVMGAVQKSTDGHPFKPLLDMDIELKEDKLKSIIEQVLKHVNSTSSEVRRLFLIEDLVDSVKFGLLLWVLTYIGSWFNGMTLIILAVICLFTLPKVYETYQVQIDNYIGLAKAQVDNVLKIVQSKVPFLKKKEKPQ